MHTSAPGKLILCGEHAVVYGHPAIAMPIHALQATITSTASAPNTGLVVEAPDLGRVWHLHATAPLSDLARRTLDFLGTPEPDLALTIRSTIPIASGMGSGAAVGAALVRALAAAVGRTLDPATVSALVYESERTFHGTPSGIDNTVVAYEQPIWFQRRPQQAPLIEPLHVEQSLTFVVADTGVASSTKAVVGDLRQRWEEYAAPYEAHFTAIGSIVTTIRRLLSEPNDNLLGSLLTMNHKRLQMLGVSSPELDRLVDAAIANGALGAKMSGAGWGGVMLAFVESERAKQVATALGAAGAVQTWITRLERL